MWSVFFSFRTTDSLQLRDDHQNYSRNKNTTQVKNPNEPELHNIHKMYERINKRTSTDKYTSIQVDRLHCSE